MVNKTLVLNEKTHLVNQIMSLAYSANKVSGYLIGVDYHPQIDSLAIVIFSPEARTSEYLYKLSLYLEPCSLEELHKFKDILEMFLEGKDISGFKQMHGYGTLTLWSHGDWHDYESVAVQ